MDKQKLLKENGLNVAFAALVVAIALKTTSNGWGTVFIFYRFFPIWIALAILHLVTHYWIDYRERELNSYIGGLSNALLILFPIFFSDSGEFGSTHHLVSVPGLTHQSHNMLAFACVVLVVVLDIFLWLKTREKRRNWKW
ncbi:hypothetical protein BT049_RS23385 [Vibrio parahaemolyticus]|nr:hypothetical protein [Vibrio parahaemolyticus]ELA7163788.1 hypothetical protein [Vibrio parahaemolyticus]